MNLDGARKRQSARQTRKKRFRAIHKAASLTRPGCVSPSLPNLRFEIRTHLLECGEQIPNCEHVTLHAQIAKPIRVGLRETAPSKRETGRGSVRRPRAREEKTFPERRFTAPPYLFWSSRFDHAFRSVDIECATGVDEEHRMLRGGTAHGDEDT